MCMSPCACACTRIANWHYSFLGKNWSAIYIEFPIGNGTVNMIVLAYQFWLPKQKMANGQLLFQAGIYRRLYQLTKFCQQVGVTYSYM